MYIFPDYMYINIDVMSNIFYFSPIKYAWKPLPYAGEFREAASGDRYDRQIQQ
jgi:hypothetical protein